MIFYLIIEHISKWRTQLRDKGLTVCLQRGTSLWRKGQVKKNKQRISPENPLILVSSFKKKKKTKKHIWRDAGFKHRANKEEFGMFTLIFILRHHSPAHFTHSAEQTHNWTPLEKCLF